MIIKKIGLVVKSLNDSIALGREIYKFLTSRGIEVYVDDWSAGKMDLQHESRKIEDMDVDIIITLGGDGTILKTVSLIKGKKIPVFGINFGTMGFLTEITPKYWKGSLEKILEGNFIIEKKDKLSVKVNNKKVGDALNEVVIMTSLPVKMLYFRITVNDQVVDDIKSDGVIISTPTGSTAYSMSAGGPIVDPRVSAFVITPIAPFRSRIRSLVVPRNSTIEVRALMPKKEALVVVDGELAGKLPPGGEAKLTLSGSKAYFVKIGGDFYEKIRERL
jgi:NAD+ kinase